MNRDSYYNVSIDAIGDASPSSGVEVVAEEAGKTTVSLAEFEANPCSTIKAPIKIYNVTEVVGDELNISFVPAVVHVTDISRGDIGGPPLTT